MKRKRSAATQKTTPRKSQSTASQSQSESPTKGASKRKQTVPKKKDNYTSMLVLGKKSRVKNKLLREIKLLQRTTRLLIPKASFGRVIKEITMDYGSTDMRIQVFALEALQEAAETYLVDLFEDSYLCALHSNRVTLLVRDILLARQIRREI